MKVRVYSNLSGRQITISGKDERRGKVEASGDGESSGLWRLQLPTTDVMPQIGIELLGHSILPSKD